MITYINNVNNLFIQLQKLNLKDFLTLSAISFISARVKRYVTFPLRHVTTGSFHYDFKVNKVQ